jgi:hypothetical protein
VSGRFDELVGDVSDPAERERLRRVHELLLSVEPPPELSPAVVRPLPPTATPFARRRRAALALLAAALAAAAFGAGWLGGARSDDVALERVISMAGVGEGRGGFASIELLHEDAAGNWPMRVLVRGLEPSRNRADFYELWLTKDGEPAESCGRFIVKRGLTNVTLTVPYALRDYDGWVVTRAGSEAPLLTT